MRNVADVVKVGGAVKVKVLTVDAAQRRLALTMKGMGNARAGSSGGARGGAAAGGALASFEAEDAADEAEDAGFALEAGDVAYDGVVFRVDEAAAEDEGYDEADEFELAADGELARVAALEATLVDGKVTSVEDFGVVVEWTAADGSKQSGLLHVSEMRAPAEAAAAEAGAAAADDADAADDEGAFFADEAEFASEAYVDVGGVDKPSRYYKVGDAIQCFVLGVEAGGKAELTQDVEALGLDGAFDEEGEALDLEEARALARADPANAAAAASFAAAGDDEDGADEEAFVGDASAAVYYGQSAGAAKAAGAPAFIRGKAGAAVSPASFPSRGLAVARADLRVPAAAAARLVDVDDAGDEAELVDYWSDDVGRVGKPAAFGAQIVASEEGELQIAEREGAEGAVSAGDLALLGGVTDAELDALIDALLAADGEEADEAEVPIRARRNPAPAR